MKKLLFLLAALALVAAACNTKTSQSASSESQENQNSAQNQVDATVSDINTSLNNEASINSQSDSDVLKADQSVTTDSEGVANVNY